MRAAGARAGAWVGFGDEMRLGLISQVRRVWAPRGIKVVQRVAMTREWRYLALAVDPQRGRLAWAWAPTMKQEAVAASVRSWKAAGVEAVVWDRASSHRAELVRAVGLALVEQPPYAPECNPAERVFEELRRAVEGELYPDLEAKVAAVERELQAWAADPERVKRLVGWAWVLAAFPPPESNLAPP